MIDPARSSGLSRRQFLALSAFAAAVPVLGGCTAVRRGSSSSVATGTRPGTAPAVTARTPASVRPQVRTPLPVDPRWDHSLGAGPSGPLGGSATRDGSLLVLSYHNVTADGRQPGDQRKDGYTVSAADFAGQMAMLVRSGFRSVRIADVLSASRTGRPLPPRSVLITFDDGGDGHWVYADLILEAVGFSAVSFLISGHLGANPAYMSWPEAQALARTGRWDIGAHTHDHHHFVRTGAASAKASVLINRVWDPTTATLQSLDAARAAFDTDLATHLSLLDRAGLGRPDAFAYPFSQVTDPTNDQTFAAYVDGHLKATFPLRFTNIRPGRTARPEDLRAGLLPRLEVRHGETTLDLFERIRAADATPRFGRIPGGPAGG